MLQLNHILREGFRAIRFSAAQGARRQLIRSRRAPQPEIDSSGKKRFKRAELLGNHKRGMVGQHDPARTDANLGRARSDMADDDRGSGAGDARHVVVFRQPETVIAQLLRMPREITRSLKRISYRAALHDGRKIEN